MVLGMDYTGGDLYEAGDRYRDKQPIQRNWGVLVRYPEDYSHQIGDVTFSPSHCHPSTKIDEEHFVLEVYPIKLKFEES